MNDQPIAAAPIQQVIELGPFVPLAYGEVIGSALGSYRIGYQVGAGHFGIVYECWDDWGTPLVVKVLRPHHQADQLRAAALREAQHAFQLRHPNITYVWDAFESDEMFFIVYERLAMPLVKLFDIDGFMPNLWVKPIARSVLKALHFIHNASLVHQDIHLHNVLLGWTRDEMHDDPDTGR